MRAISKKNRKAIDADPFYKVCSLHGKAFGPCGGSITIEHAIIFSGRQSDMLWSLIPLCEKHHGVNGYQDATAVNKEISHWVALNRATDDELRSISKAIDYLHKKRYLNNKYGIYINHIALDHAGPR